MPRPLLLFCCLAAIGCAPAVRAGEPYALLPGHIDLARGPDGNTVILDAPDGLIVIDTGRHPAHAQAILARASASARPVAAVVNTHWHLDHTTGNRDLLAAHPGARLVATEAVEGALTGFLAPSFEAARRRADDPALSDEQRAQARRTLAALEDRAAIVPRAPVRQGGPVEIAGRRLALRVARAAATEADLWLLVPDEDLAVVGDLVVAPVPFFDTGCEDGWRAALAEIAEAEWTTLVPGHGAPMTRADFARWRGAFERWLDCAASDSPGAACAEGWMRDAAGFYAVAETEAVRSLAEAYVTEILRKPDARMAYCRAG